MEDLRPNTQRAKNAILLIWIVFALEIISLISGYFQYNLIQSAANGNEISNEAASSNDQRESIIGIVYMLVFIVSATTFIQWFRRAYYNLHLRVSFLFHSEGWAAGSWFVPIVSLFRPFKIMRELYEETIKLLSDKGIMLKENFSTKFLGWWWALWIINNIIGQIMFRYSLHAKTIEELSTSTILGMADNIIGIPLALITIKVIKDYSEIEPLLLETNEDEAIGRHIVEGA